MAQTYHRYRAGDKPVGGYKLIRKLGEGGFGEVWQASAPGGAEVALKFIDLTGQQGFREFKSLRLVKKITHNNLTPLHGFWLKNEDGTLIDESDVTWSQLAPSAPVDPSSPPKGALATAVFAQPVELIVAMGLGKMSLYDRLRECKDDGLGGIPADELLDYMDDAARGIDYLNRPIHDMGQGPMPIVHSDIKPHNVLIVGDGAQVCDFGLAHAVESLRKTCQAPLTLAYAAPESFRGKPCDKSDQYSLAVSYVELRTGSLPFDESLTGFEVMTAHVQGQLDFSRLTPGEAAVVRKGTSPLPQDRWQSCREMVRELRKALQLTPGTSDDLPPVPPSADTDWSRHYRGTIQPPAYPKGDTAPFSGQTPIERAPEVQTEAARAATPTVHRVASERPRVPRRPMSTGAKLFVSLILLGALGGGYGFWISTQDSNKVEDNNETSKVTQKDPRSGSDSKNPVEDPQEKQRRLAKEAEEERRKDELERNAPKMAFDERLQAGQFDKALDILKTSNVFTDDEKRENTAKVQQGWRASADRAFLNRQYGQATAAYTALAKEFLDSLPVADLNLMQVRSRMGAGDSDGARALLAQVPAPTQRQTPRDRVYFLDKFLLDGRNTKNPANVDELYTVWKENANNTATKAETANQADIWTARPFEKDLLKQASDNLIASWVESAANLRATSEGLAELKTGDNGLIKLTKILEIDPQNVDALVLKADLEVAATKYAEATKTVEQKLALARQPSLPALKDRSRVLDAIYLLSSATTDEKTLKSTLADVPKLMQLKDYQEMLAGAVSVFATKSPQYGPAAVNALRAAAEAPESKFKALFGIMLQADIQRRVISEPNFVAKADDFLKDCLFIDQNVRASGQLVRACHAEALLALNRSGAKEALGEPGNSPYYLYVKARVLSQPPLDSPDELRTTLMSLFAQSPTLELKQAGRIKLAFDALEQLLNRDLPTEEFNIKRALEPRSDVKFLDAYYDLLHNAQRWSGAGAALSDVARANLAVAAWWHPTKQDARLAQGLTAGLVSEWRDNRRDELLDPRLVYQLYYTYLEAHRGVSDKPAEETSLAVVDRLITLTKKKKLDDEQAQAFYSKVIAPREPLASDLGNHAFFARAAALVADDSYLDWGFVDAEGKKLVVNSKLDQLLTSAIDLSNGKEPQYFQARGRVRLNHKPFSMKIVLQDAEALRRFKDFEVSAFSLAGQAHFYQSRQESTHAGRLAELDNALKILQQALKAGDSKELSDDQKAERLLLLSYVHLERRNFAGWDDSAVNDFEKAAGYATQAVEFLDGPALENAYSAAGNAFEDLAWYTRTDMPANYRKAVENFQLALRVNPDSVIAHINLGRCYYKMAAVSRVGAGLGTLQGIVKNAESELREAIRLAESQKHENPEAHYWLGKVLQVKHLDEATPTENAKRLLRADEFRAADDELIRAKDLAVKQNAADNTLRLFAVELAENVLLHPDFYRGKSSNIALAKVSARVDELKKLNLPPTTGVDLDQEVRVLNARATMLTKSGIAALSELDEEASKLRKLNPDKATASDSKLMELRFEIFDKLKPSDLTPERIEDWLSDAIWYAKLPRTVIRNDPTTMLTAARSEAEKLKLPTAGETAFTALEADWLQAAIESSSTRLTAEQGKRLQQWYVDLLTLYARQHATLLKTNPKEAADLADRAATKLENLIAFLDKRGRKSEADKLREHATFFRDKSKAPTSGTTKASPASRTTR